MVSLQTTLFALALAGAGDTVLLDFYSDSCGPCRQMDPVVQRLAAAGYPVRKVDVEDERELAGRFGITRIPCFVLVVDGKEADRTVGATSYERLEAMCQLGLARHKPRQPSAADHPRLPAVQETAGTSAAPGVPVPAVQSGSAFPAGSSQAAQADASPPGWRMIQADPVPNAETSAGGPSDQQLIGATVRLRIQDRDGHSCGTGTIIDAREGEALVATCGHIFRDSKGKGRIDVDLFGPTSARKISGRLICYDLDRDVGLISIRTPGPVTVARVAPPGYEIQKGARVATVGCNNAADPTVRRSRITSLDKFMGPPNIQVAGLPVQGRSGGGLFSSEGYLIGICNAADPADNEGLYAALASVHAQLDEMKLGHIYQPDATGSHDTLVAAEPPAMPEEMPSPDKLLQLTDVPSRLAGNNSLPAPPQTGRAALEATLSPEEQAALEEIRQRRAEGAEVVCVIRSLSDPSAKSEIIVLDKASPAFLKQLETEGRSRVQRQLTSLDLAAATRRAGQSNHLPDDDPTAPQSEPASASNWQPNWVAPTAQR